MKKYSRQDQVELTNWALNCAERVLCFFERAAPEDGRPRQALAMGREWVQTGIFRMATIRAASLAAHAAAKEVASDPPAASAAHACGQAVATAHVPQHAYGGAYYALKALIGSDPGAAARLVREELDWQARQLPDRLRDGIMSRIVVRHGPKGLSVTIRKGPGF